MRRCLKRFRRRARASRNNAPHRDSSSAWRRAMATPSDFSDGAADARATGKYTSRDPGPSQRALQTQQPTPNGGANHGIVGANRDRSF